jgi:hypothetical protein
MLASLRWMDEQQQDALVLSGGWLCRRQVSRPPDQVTVTPLDGAAAPTGSPITLAGNRSLAYLARAGATCRGWLGQAAKAHYFTLYGRQ